MTDDIAYAKIHPAIGVARVGNSTREDGWFHGPETPGPEPAPVGFHKDGTGAIKRDEHGHRPLRPESPPLPQQ
jgi:hypothetical protein